MGLAFLLFGATALVPQQNPSIQAAVDAAKPGDVVLVSAGEYQGPVRLRSGVTLRSEGDDARGRLGLLRAEKTTIRGGVEMAKDACLDGFTVTDVGKYDEKVWRHDYETRGQEQSHEPIGAPGLAGVAVAADCIVRGNIVHHVGYTGIAVTGGSPKIIGNVCFRNMGGGIGSMRGAAPLIEGNLCYENLFAGIGCDASSPLIKGNECRDNVRAGIGVSDGSSPRVVGNRCAGNRRAGIGIRSGPSTRPVVEDNDCLDNGMAGIGVEEGARPVLAGNRIVGNRLVGIGVSGSSSAVITGNRIARTGGAPPLVAVLPGSYASLVGNTFEGGGVAGVLVRGEADVRDNRFVRTGASAGRAVWAQPGSKVTHGANAVEGWKESVSASPGAVVTEVVPAPLPPAR